LATLPICNRCAIQATVTNVSFLNLLFILGAYLYFRG
jgi:hypothetical protein